MSAIMTLTGTFIHCFEEERCKLFWKNLHWLHITGVGKGDVEAVLW